MIKLIESVAIEMLDEKTPMQNLVFVVALLFFFILIKYLGEKESNAIISFAKFALGLLSVVTIVSIVAPYFRTTSIAQSSSVTSDELIGLYMGRIQPLNPESARDLFVTMDNCRLNIESDLNCALYSENDTSKQYLGKLPSIKQATSLYIPKIGWAICRKKETQIMLHSDSLKNNNYFFNFSK